MRCVALLSGGKDSVAAIDVAQGHGWDVVAALCLLPAEDDSYMFHTPNLSLVPGVAAAMALPVESVTVPADPVPEIGALEEALAKACEAHKADAVLSGALASDYQRTRLDQVAHRIGVRSLAPLWHKRPSVYMAWLLEAGYDIRFSRVAADGLDASWAGRSLDSDALAALAALRIHVAGEGGEYESLVLDAPHFTSRIVVTDAHVEATASRATWHVDHWHLEPKDGPARSGSLSSSGRSRRSVQGGS